ncbi:hypothetical protein V1478_004143 [Vespula squamosa]|uniref:Uncharacterized protein n=1 Tax=Vespula squamosa TaxID=30214 RepID=A0ABD2BP44_VESSQ
MIRKKTSVTVIWVGEENFRIRTHARQLVSVHNESGRIILLCTAAFIKPAHGVEDDDDEDGDGKSDRDDGGV